MTSATTNSERPNIFVVFGMPRSGTTFLHHTLQAHPEIFVPYRKESYYFTANYDKGLAWFRDLYQGQLPGQIGADINPMYYLDPVAIERVRAYAPGIKVILGVREPVDFAISLYGNMLAHGLAVGRITDVIRGYEWELTPEFAFHFQLDGTFLQRKVADLRSAFGDDLLLYDFAHFDANPTAVLSAIERFLGLTPYFTESNVDNVKINASGRRDLLLLNRLVTNQRVLDMVYAVFPKGAIRTLRRWYERMSVRSDGAAAARAPTNEVTPEERSQLEREFASDVGFYRSLFARERVLAGDGDRAHAGRG